jgi:hypothetical protein
MKLYDKQLGFSPLFIALLLCITGVVGFAGWRVFSQKKSNNNTPAQETTSPIQQSDNTRVAEEALSLQNLGIDISSGVIVTEDALVDLAKGFKGFYGFGEPLPPDNKRTNPNFEFASVAADTPIIAAIDGEIVNIEAQTESNDSEIFIKTSNRSVWTVSYDHVTNLKVKKGDRVTAGTVLGNAAIQNNGLYRFELQINKDEKGTTTHHCPMSLVVDSQKSTLSSELKNMMQQWNELAGKPLYGLDSQDPIGCTKLLITSKEAEGI